MELALFALQKGDKICKLRAVKLNPKLTKMSIFNLAEIFFFIRWFSLANEHSYCLPASSIDYYVKM